MPIAAAIEKGNDGLCSVREYGSRLLGRVCRDEAPLHLDRLLDDGYAESWS